MEARRHKLHVLGGKTVLWHDANIRVANPEHMRRGRLCLMRHHLEGSWEDEASLVKEWRRDYADIVDEQVEHYRAIGVPTNIPRAATGVYYADFRDAQVRRFFNIWLEEVKRHSIRDQISVAYAIWMSGVQPHWVPRETNGPNVFKKPHKHGNHTVDR